MGNGREEKVEADSSTTDPVSRKVLKKIMTLNNFLLKYKDARS